MAAEVVVRVKDEEFPEIPTEVIVRAEEVLLVALVLMIWVAAIVLFFNRWGKIRMLEPYQPKFQQQHRTSCPMGEAVITPQQRMSFSKYNVNCLGEGNLYNTLPSPNSQRRPRQNSVFVGSSTMAILNPPRRVKSAIDIQHMVLSDYSPGSLSGCSSLLPMLGNMNTKRPSITIDKARQHRASVVLDYPFIAHHNHPSKTYLRRPSCLVDRPPIGRHRHFISFDQPTTSWDRRTSITIERPSTSRHHSVFERPCVSLEQPSLIIEPPSTSQEHPPTSIAEGSSHMHGRSCPESMNLHQPSTSYIRRPSFHLDMPPVSPNRQRLSVSLEHTAGRMERRSSQDVRLCARSPVSASFDETQMKLSNLSNLEHSKVSDV